MGILMWSTNISLARLPGVTWTLLSSKELGDKALGHYVTATNRFWVLLWRSESESVSCSFMSNSLWLHGLWPSSLLCPWSSPGKNTGVGWPHSKDPPHKGVFPTQGLNPGLLYYRQIVYCLSHQGSPLETKGDGFFFFAGSLAKSLAIFSTNC